MTPAQEELRFLKSKKPTFTLTSLATGCHFSFQLKHPKHQDVSDPKMSYVFVHPLNGERTYLGYVDWTSLDVRAGAKGDDRHHGFIALRWYLDCLRKGSVPCTAKVSHAGKCGHCSRQLTDPESLRTGLGPECRRKI